MGTDGLVNRTVLTERFTKQFYFDSFLVNAMTNATNLCPEPVFYDLDPFIGCLRDACLNSVPGLSAIVADLQYKEPMLQMSQLPTNAPPEFASGFGFM